MPHEPVLLNEVVELLNPQPGETVLDATINRGGHALPLAQRIGKSGTLIGLDVDSAAISAAGKILAHCPLAKLILRVGNFRHLTKIFNEVGVTAVHCALFDLGWSAEQMAQSGRGFSFDRAEPLLMTLGEPAAGSLTAGEIVNEWSESSLIDVIRGYGGERFAKRIVQAIVEARATTPITRADQLAQIVRDAVPVWYRHRHLHPATRTFQALRLAVNDELGALREALPAVWQCLAPDGRLAVIAFHELEARIVKKFFLERVRAGAGRLLTKRAIVPGLEELSRNPRSRSATLRVISKL